MRPLPLALTARPPAPLRADTGFIDNNYLLFHKEVLDRACKDKAHKEFEPLFKIEM
jgi:hypothetical protein